MTRTEAARVLGVEASASPRRVERAFRALAREAHPDRFEAGSPAWFDAADRLMALTEARRVLQAPAPPDEPVAGVRVAGTTEAGDRWAWAQDAPPPPEAAFVVDERAIQRRRRTWGLAWGSFLVSSAVVSYAVGATQPVNDAMPIWSPALLLTGLVALALGLRAHRHL